MEADALEAIFYAMLHRERPRSTAQDRLNQTVCQQASPSQPKGDWCVNYRYHSIHVIRYIMSSICVLSWEDHGRPIGLTPSHRTSVCCTVLYDVRYCLAPSISAAARVVIVCACQPGICPMEPILRRDDADDVFLQSLPTVPYRVRQAESEA